MDELILQPDESLILQPGEGIGAGDEPLRIRVGLVEFASAGGSVQQQLLDSVAQCLRLAVPSGWQIRVEKHLRHLVDQLTSTPLVVIVPKDLSWNRTAKGRQHAVHEIDIVVAGFLDTDSTVALIDQWAEIFLDGGGSLDRADCMHAVTIDGAEAGFDADALTNTPSAFFGGLRLTFWSL
jgi:hypothetical protein